MNDLSFKLSDVDEKPSRQHKRRSNKYDPMINKFCEGKAGLAKVEVPGQEANYLRMQLKKRIDARELDGQIEVTVINNATYLEKK